MSCTSMKTRGRCTGRPAGATQSDGLSQERSEQSPAMEGTLIHGTPPPLTCPRQTGDQATGVGYGLPYSRLGAEQEVSEDHDRQSRWKPKKAPALPRKARRAMWQSIGPKPARVPSSTQPLEAEHRTLAGFRQRSASSLPR
jgi:hypothetical protein